MLSRWRLAGLLITDNANLFNKELQWKRLYGCVSGNGGNITVEGAISLRGV